MKILGALSLAVVASLPMWAAAATPADDLAVQELIALEEKWVQAENVHDTGTLRTMLDERFNKANASD